MNDSTLAALRFGVLVDQRAVRQKRTWNSYLIGVPLLGTLYAIYHFRSHPMGTLEISSFAIFYLLTGIGIGIGFHRCFTHQSFRAVRWLKILLLFLGSLAFQGSVIRWVADHRRHHRLSDRCWDTHSPHFAENAALEAGIRGLFHAHLGWMFDRTTTDLDAYAPDLLKDRDFVFFHRYYFAATIVSLALPYLVGLVASGREAAFGCLLMGGCVRTTVLHNFIWAVNSLGHSVGAQDASTRDSSRNGLLLALATFGEGWHNNHHADPRSAFNNWKWYQLDFNGRLVWILAKLGLVKNVVTTHCASQRGQQTSSQDLHS